MTGQQPRSRRRPSPHFAHAKPDVRRCYPLRNAAARPLTTGYVPTPLVHTACDGAIDISAAALPSPGGYGFLAEYPVKPHLGSPVSVCAACNGCGAVSAGADALAGRGDDTLPLQDASR